MRHLLILLVGLLLASVAWAQPSGKGMIANCANADIISGACAGLGTGTRVYDTDNSVELTYDGSSWVNSGGTGTFLNLVATGTITGLIDIVTTTTGTDSPSIAEMRGTLHIADHGTPTSDVVYTLPEISTVGAGASACFYDNGGGDGGITLTPDAADEFLLDGEPITAGDTVDSPGIADAGANGDYLCIVAIDNTYWATMGRSGVWVDGGP